MTEPTLDPAQIRAVADIQEAMPVDVWGVLIEAEEGNEIWIQFDVEAHTSILDLNRLHDQLTQIEPDAADRIIWELDEAAVEEVDGVFHMVIEAILITDQPESIGKVG